MRDMTLRQLEVVRAVMTTGTINGAATLLGVSAPAVSRLVKHTEHSLGLRLFERKGGLFVPAVEAGPIFEQPAALEQGFVLLARLQGYFSYEPSRRGIKLLRHQTRPLHRCHRWALTPSASLAAPVPAGAPPTTSPTSSGPGASAPASPRVAPRSPSASSPAPST